MEDSASQEPLLHRLQVGTLNEGLVAPNMIRPPMEVKIIKPDDGKGMVPPSLVQLPAPDSPPTAQPSTPPVPGLVPPNVVPPVQAQPPPVGNPPVQAQPPQAGNPPTK